MNTDDFRLAFQNGAEFESGYGKLSFQTFELGSLVLTSGKIVAADPLFINAEASAFEVAPAPGEYPVTLNIAHNPKNADQRVAFAMIQFQNQIPVRFRMALTAGQSLADLAEGQFYGYGVDSGTGCFTDADNTRIFDESDSDALIADIKKTYVHTWSWVNLKVNPVTGGNIVAFPSGYGDGAYSSYFGYAENDALVCLVTDFGVFDSKDD